MLKNMHDSNFGVWVAHGEGNFTFANDSVMNSIKSDKCVAIRYTDDDGNATTRLVFVQRKSVYLCKFINEFILGIR